MRISPFQNRRAGGRQKKSEKLCRYGIDVTCAPRGRERALNFDARARKNVFTRLFERAGGQASPTVEEAWPSARARARAKYKPKLQNNHFFVSKL